MNRDERSSGSQPGVMAADPMIGQTIERYRLTERLGEGGMGEVYAAKHLHIEKRVAIKLLRREILTNQEAVARFRQEALSASSIGHRNIIAIEDLGELPDGRVFLTMELLAGAPLSDLIKTPQPPERLINILIQTGHGLAAAHKKGIVHRDMKPENVFVTITPEGEDVPKLLDFGIAKVSGADGNNHLTKTGTIFGTPFYMAPEQALGQNVDHRADIYAMGVIMYEVFGGAVPFQGESFMGILTQHITAEPKPPARMAAEHGRVLPPGTEEIILRSMRKDPDQRYQSMDELVAALVNVYRGLAGAGMSSYLPAHGSGLLPLSQGPMAPRGMSHTPTPYASTPGPGGQPILRDISSPYHVPHPDPPFTGHGSGLLAADSGPIPRRKSKAGLIAVLFIVMAAIGGGVALLVLSQQHGRAKGKEPDPIAKGPDVGGGGKIDPANGKQGGAGGTSSDLGGGTTADLGDGKSGDGKSGDGKHGGGQTIPEVKADAGVAESDGGDDASDGGAPAVAKVVVLVNSRPQGAEIFGPDGKSLGKTPTNVWVEPGQALEVTLKLKGRKDLRASIDDHKKKVNLHLERLPRPPDHAPPGGGDGGAGTPETTPPRDVCEQDPGSVECRCKKNPDLPECGLE